jgi:hypothetical protein
MKKIQVSQQQHILDTEPDSVYRQNMIITGK